MFSEGLYGWLAACTAVTTALGTSRSDKTTGIFPGLAPDQTPVPYLTLEQVTGEPLQESFQGTGALQTARWRFSCYGATSKQAKNLANVLKQNIINMIGALPGGAGNGYVQGAWFRFEGDDKEPIPHGTLYSTHVDFEFNYLDV
jgi:Protein of unknown function (DUF3168)